MTMTMTMAMTDLEQHIQSTPIVDTHEHMSKEDAFVSNGPDILRSLFDGYSTSDLVSAGASGAALGRMGNANDLDVRGRFEGIRAAWEHIQFTGFGEGVRWIAKNIFGIDELTGEAIERAAPRAQQLRQPGQRLHLLKEVANLDHIQTDDFVLGVAPDASGPDFFLYDLSWWKYCGGTINSEELRVETGIEVKNLATLDQAFEAVFAKYAPLAIAVKSQHAYDRTLLWEKRDDADAERVLFKVIAGETLTAGDKLCLGDWCLARGAALAGQHNLPFKLHTGYYAGNGTMPVHYMRAGQLSLLLAEYPQTKFVLMHTAYPYTGEIVALAKHYPNVFADMCWAWSIDPYTSESFVRQMIHAAPANKLFVFGGDANWPYAAVAYAWQARRGLTQALQAEINHGSLTERQAIHLATRFLRANQLDCFDVEGVRKAISDLIKVNQSSPTHT